MASFIIVTCELVAVDKFSVTVFAKVFFNPQMRVHMLV